LPLGGRLPGVQIIKAWRAFKFDVAAVAVGVDRVFVLEGIIYPLPADYTGVPGYFSPGVKTPQPRLDLSSVRRLR